MVPLCGGTPWFVKWRRGWRARLARCVGDGVELDLVGTEVVGEVAGDELVGVDAAGGRRSQSRRTWSATRGSRWTVEDVVRPRGG